MSAQPVPRPTLPTKGFVQDPRIAFEHWPRLISGDAQNFSLRFIQHNIPFDGKSQFTPPIANEELAAYARCTVRAIEYALLDLVARKVVTRKKTAGGFAYSIPFETWPELPDRPPKVQAMAEPETAEEETDDDSKARRGQVTPVFSRPQKVRAGSRTRPKELPSPAGKLQFEAENTIEFDARMCDGILTIRAKGEESAEQGRTAGEGKTKSISLGKAQTSDSKEPENFHIFESTWLRFGINAGVNDWRESRRLWAELDIGERLAAVKGIVDRFEQGEFDAAEPKWIPLPQKYLANKGWLRPVRPKTVRSKEEQRLADLKKYREEGHARLRAREALRNGTS